MGMFRNLLIVIVLYYFLFLMLEGRSWWKNPWRPEYYWALLILFLSLAYTIDLVQGWHLLPNPAALFAKLKPLSDLLYSI